MNNSLLVFVHSLRQPRVGRRIKQLFSIFEHQVIFGFDRNIYKQPFSIEGGSYDLRFLGDISKGVGVKRLLMLLIGILKICFHVVRNRPKCIYCFSIDTGLAGLIGWILRIPFVYEISDLHVTKKSSGIRARILLILENTILRSAHTVVVTSPYFLEDLSSRVSSVRRKTVVIENGLPLDVARVLPRKKISNRTAETERVISIGLIGAVKYWSVLENVLEVCLVRFKGRFRVEVYGDNYPNVDGDIPFKDMCDIFFHGPFKNPDDLEKIYTSVDLVLSVYDVLDENVRLALPNKLYEAVYFGRPLIVSRGTALAREVDAWSVGFDVDPYDYSELVSFFGDINAEQVVEKSENCFNVKSSKLLSNPAALDTRLGSNLEVVQRSNC